MDPPMGNWGAPLASSGERQKVSPAGGCEGNWRSSAGPWLGRRGIRQTPKARRLVPGMWEIQASSGRGTHALGAPGDRAEGRTDAQERPGEHSQGAELAPAPTPQPCPRSSLLSEAESWRASQQRSRTRHVEP